MNHEIPIGRHRQINARPVPGFSLACVQLISEGRAVWIEALDNYVIIKTSSKEQFILHSSMKDIEAKLPPLNFARVHRSYIVQLEKIGALEENACIIDGNRIPIGKSYKENLMSRLNLF